MIPYDKLSVQITNSVSDDAWDICNKLYLAEALYIIVLIYPSLYEM